MKLFLLLILLGTFPPLATDMYLPAIPTIQNQWNASLSIINLSLSLFFIGLGISLLICGPLADRFGRRPVLLWGIGLYVAASLMCGLAAAPFSLNIFRTLQGVGAATAMSLGMAVCRDKFEGERRSQILAYIATAIALAPMLAPMLGAWILSHLDWQWIFVVQAFFGMISFVGVWYMNETLTIVSDDFQVLRRYAAIFRNAKFMVFNVMMAFSACSIFAFIAGSGDVYMKTFGFSEQQFSYFFGFNAFAFMMGAFLCSRLVRKLPSRTLITAGFVGVLAGGIWMSLIGRESPWNFAIPMFGITLCFGLSRPVCNSEALEYIASDAGAASSLLIFTQFVMAAISMWFISLKWINTISILSVMAMGSAIIALILCTWLLWSSKQNN